MAGTKEKITVLIGSFAVFAAGVWALYSERGVLRTGMLTAAFILLGIIALRQTFQKWRGKK